MIAFDIIKFVQHIILIALLFAALTFICDQIYPAYEQMFVATGNCTELSFQVMTILHYGADAFIIAGFILACVNAIASAQAKREYLTGGSIGGSGINMGIKGSIICFVVILIAISFNFIITAFFDMGIIAIDSALPTPEDSPFYVFSSIQTLFNYAHYIPLFMLVVGYLYMLFGTFIFEAIDSVRGVQ